MIYMKIYNLVVVENGNDICLGNDVTSIEVKDDELVFVHDNNEQEGVYPLNDADSVIIKVNR